MSYRGIGAASTMFEHAVQMCWLIDIAGLKRATSSMKSSYPYARSGQTIGLLVPLIPPMRVMRISRVKR
jgi:hypothetical protein